MRKASVRTALKTEYLTLWRVIILQGYKGVFVCDKLSVRLWRVIILQGYKGRIVYATKYPNLWRVIILQGYKGMV